MITFLIVLEAITLQPKFYTNTNYFYQITGQEQIIFGATNGGLVEYRMINGSFRSLTNSDGLPMNQLNCVGLDSSKGIWAGCDQGLAWIDSSLSQVLRYPIDCLSCMRIYELYCLRDTVLVGTGDGLLFIETRDTPDNFRDDRLMTIYDINGLPSNNIVALASDDSSFWIGTDAGLARCSKDFHQIVTYTTNNGLLDNYINDLVVHDTLLFVGTDNGLNRFHAGRFDSLLIGYAIKAIACSADSLLLALEPPNQVGIFINNTLAITNAGLPPMIQVNDVYKISNQWCIGLGSSTDNGYYGFGLGFNRFFPSDTLWSIRVNDCLPSNHINDICVSDSGIFLSLGVRTNGQLSQGIAWMKNDGSWRHMTMDTIIPSGNNVHRCETGPDGKIWFALNPISFATEDSILIYAFQPSTDDWFFVKKPENTDAVWDIKLDKVNNIYVQIGRTPPPMNAGNRTWIIDTLMIPRLYIPPQKEGFFDELAIDSAYRIWRTIASDPGSGAEGLVMTDTRTTIFNPDDDLVKIYSTGDGLLSKKCRGCIIGNNIIYIATDLGLAIFDGITFSSVTSFSNPDLIDVTLDSENRIWILGYQSVSFYDPEYKFIKGWPFNSLNITPEFITDPKEIIQVQGFTFDPYRHCLWLGGNNGLLKLEISQNDNMSLDSIIVYPNPVLGGNIVRIKNVPADASVNIYSIAGRCLAKNLTCDLSFREVVWQIPEGLASGLYFALVKASCGKEIIKFTIVR